MSNEALKLAKSVTYDIATKEVVVILRDGSRHAWPVRLLEMVKSEAHGWIPLDDVTDQQLLDVQVYGGGRYILWDELGQAFKIVDLLSGVYGREEWMQKLMATVP
ncbi:MAG: hypothetical protein AAF716_11965 [Cyanobacteria bacterium P01_D01_bin.1]